MKTCIFLFSRNNISLCEWNSLKFIWYLTFNTNQLISKKKVMHQYGHESYPLKDLKNAKNMVYAQIYMVLDHQQNAGLVRKRRLCISLARRYGP